jgi:hypothetical protein
LSGVDLRSAELPDARIACLIGPTGCGKTEVSRRRARLFPRVLFVDSQAKDGKGEYAGLVIRTPAELAEFLEERGDEPRWRVAYRGPVFFPLDARKPDGPKSAERFFDALAELEDVLVVVEEAETYMDADRAPEGLFTIARKGRRFGQALTLVSHRFTDIARDLTAVADLVVVWPLGEPGDLKSAAARGFPLDVMATLQGHDSIRRRMPEGERTRFYVCRCSSPHSGTCGEPIPLPPVKVRTGRKEA